MVPIMWVRACLCPLILALGVCAGQWGVNPPWNLSELPIPSSPPFQQPLCRRRAGTSGVDALRQHKAEPRGISGAIFPAPLLTNKLLCAGDAEASAAAGTPCHAVPSRASWTAPLLPHSQPRCPPIRHIPGHPDPCHT